MSTRLFRDYPYHLSTSYAPQYRDMMLGVAVCLGCWIFAILSFMAGISLLGGVFLVFSLPAFIWGVIQMFFFKRAFVAYYRQQGLSDDDTQRKWREIFPYIGA